MTAALGEAVEMQDVRRAGVIGLGAMGSAMARHMAAKGFCVAGYDIDPAAMRRAEALGVEPCGSAAELAGRADVVVVMVQTDAQVEAAVEGSGLLVALPAGAVICIASSVLPETCRRLASRAEERGLGLLDTPVALGQEGADAGALTVFAGGEAKWLERALPVLKCFAKNIFHLGDVGQGQIAKTVNNMLLWACISADFEALTLAKRLGADMPRLIEALCHGSGANRPLSRWGRSTGKWAAKDLEAALRLAEEAGVFAPQATLAKRLMQGTGSGCGPCWTEATAPAGRGA
jgi:3-hydroxyisobutyrate dehydrogenase-like beta-hydroxyacid dehydrogenase